MKKVIIVILSFFFLSIFVFWLIGYLAEEKITNQTEEQGAAPNKLSANALFLFYNKDLISSPPLTWLEFKEKVSKVKEVDGEEVKIAGTALGRADNVAYAPEILVSLMLQQGITWPFFDNELGEIALKFYLEFADPLKKVYTWNEWMENSIEAFAQGKAAMIFAYERDRNKFLDINFGLAPLPKIEIEQEQTKIPLISESEKAVLSEMIEAAASGRKSVAEALSEGAKQIRELND
jgi:ABC-type glycerol-3-phosphate transport system substrate-binding protein